MTNQITGRPATGRRTIRRWAADTVWQHTGRQHTYPIVNDTVHGTWAELDTLTQTNPHIHQHGRPVRIGIRADGQDQYAVRVTRTDVAHPIRSPRIAKARRTARRAVRRTSYVAAPIAGIAAAGWIVQAVWGEQIMHALKVAGGAALTILLAAAAILVMRSFAVGHPCPGLHCPNCGGGH